MQHYALVRADGTIRQFVPANSLEVAQGQAEEGELVVPFEGRARAGGVYRDGQIAFPTPTAEQQRAEAWAQVRRLRNALLDASVWAAAAGSPLTADCQAAFVTYRAQLHRVTVDFAEPDQVTWPTEPALAYAANA